MGVAGFFDGAPQLQQIVEIPLQLFHTAANAGGAGDQAHAVRHVELAHGGFKLLALFAFDTAGNAAAARIVRHEHEIAAGQADEGGERGTFVTAFIFFHLHDDLHTFLQYVLDAGAAAVVVLEVGAGNFFEGEEAVAVGAVVHEASLERGLDAGDDAFVDIAFALFFAQRFNVEIEQVLPVYNRHAQLFGLGGVK